MSRDSGMKAVLPRDTGFPFGSEPEAQPQGRRQPVLATCRDEKPAWENWLGAERNQHGLKTRATGKRLVTRAVVILLALASLCLPRPVHGQAQVAGEVVREATEQIFKQAGREGIEQLAEMGGRQAVQEVLEQSAREGGDQLVRKVTQYGIEDGPAALRAIGRSPAKMVAALDGLSPELRTAGLQAVERNPQLMTDLIRQYGSGAMEVAARHPGVGEKLTQTLGTDGIKLGRELTTDQSIVAARYAEDISKLAPAEGAGVVGKIGQMPGRVLGFLEAHPRTLRTAAGVALVMAIKDDIIGDKAGTTVLPDGTVVTTVSHPGLIERMFPSVSRFAYQPMMILAGVLAVGIAGWFGVHLWGKWRIQALRAAAQRRA